MSDLYREAAELLLKLEKRQGGLKSLAYAEDIQHKRSSFALVCETLRYKPLLQELLQAVPAFKLGQFKAEKKTNNKTKGNQQHQQQRALVWLCLYDLLFGKHKKIQGGGALKKKVMQYANAFREALVRKKIKAKVKDQEELLPVENRKQNLALPRFVRINTLKIQQNDPEMQHFRAQYNAQLDPDVADLLVLPSGTELHENSLVQDGKIVLQDKASCFPAYILHGEHGDDDDGDLIDACAAPGNKTSHAAMLIAARNNQNGRSTRTRKVFAFDRSVRRLETLTNRMQQVGADHIVEPCLKDFLQVDVTESTFANVTSILLDPSCSGSGMINRLDHLLDIASSQDTKVCQHQQQDKNEYEENQSQSHSQSQSQPGQARGDTKDQVDARLDSLADFQLKALLKAFSFPKVTRITYSTCSVFEKENEQVVWQALNSHENRTLARPFALKKCLRTWPRRGVAMDGLSSEQSDCLVRANGLEDHTNGFFVAYFERETQDNKAKPAARKPKAETIGTPSSCLEEQDEAHEHENKKRKRNKKKKSRKSKKPKTNPPAC